MSLFIYLKGRRYFLSISNSLSSKPDENEFLNLLIRIKFIIIKESRKRVKELSFQNDASFKKIEIHINWKLGCVSKPSIWYFFSYYSKFLDALPLYIVLYVRHQLVVASNNSVKIFHIFNQTNKNITFLKFLGGKKNRLFK